MTIDTEELFSLPIEEKLRLVELIWENIENSSETLPIPQSTRDDVKKRRGEMSDLKFGLSHDEIWQRVDGNDG